MNALGYIYPGEIFDMIMVMVEAWLYYWISGADLMFLWICLAQVLGTSNPSILSMIICCA